MKDIHTARLASIRVQSADNVSPRSDLVCYLTVRNLPDGVIALSYDAKRERVSLIDTLKGAPRVTWVDSPGAAGSTQLYSVSAALKALMSSRRIRVLEDYTFLPGGAEAANIRALSEYGFDRGVEKVANMVDLLATLVANTIKSDWH